MKEFIVSEQCLFCRKKFSWNQVIIIKAPEWACFCMDCEDKFEDTNKYKGKEWWIVHEYNGQEKFEYIAKK